MSALDKAAWEAAQRSMKAATDAKLRGNALVKEQSYAAAADCYTRALRELDKIPVGDEKWIALQCAVLSNRALTALKLGKPGDCVADCDTLLALESGHVKALYRKGLALEELGKLGAAERALDAALKADPKAQNKSAAAALVRVRRKRGSAGGGGGGESKGASSSKGSRKKKSSDARKAAGKKAAGKSKFDLSGLYAEKPGTKQRKLEAKRKAEAGGPNGSVSEKEHAERLYLRAQRMVEEAAANGVGSVGGCSNPSHSHGPPGLDRTFQALMDKKVFRARLFQGIEYDKSTTAPGSMKELVNDPRYAPAIRARMIKVEKKAASVLENVKRKNAGGVGPSPGAEGQGQGLGEMDALTEAYLKPQIFREAFAVELPAMVDATHRRQHAERAGDDDSVANPYAISANWKQLGPEVMRGLADSSRGFAVLDGFFDAGEDSGEWMQLIRDDLERLRADKGEGSSEAGGDKDGSFVPAPTLEMLDGKKIHRASRAECDGTDGGRRAYIELTPELEEVYPALAELVTRLHGVPYELNRRSDGRWRLSRALSNSTIATVMRGPITWTAQDTVKAKMKRAKKEMEKKANAKTKAMAMASKEDKNKSAKLAKVKMMKKGGGEGGEGSGVEEEELTAAEASVKAAVDEAIAKRIPEPATSQSKGGDYQSDRLDGGAVGTDADNGHKVTCTYFCNPKWRKDHGGELKLTSPSGEEHVIEPKADRLVLWRSRTVRNEVLPVTSKEGEPDRWAVTLFVHGKEEGF